MRNWPDAGMMPMLPLFRPRAAGALISAIIAIAASAAPAAALRSCTNAELRRISDAWTINCFSHTGAQVKCQSNGDPVCCFYTGPWKGYQCTSSPSYVSPGRVDPGSGPTRPPRVGTPGLPPGRADPGPVRPPRTGVPGSPPDSVGPPSRPIQPPRFDPAPQRIGPPAGPSIR
jgi:hypothetical protein